MIGTFRYSLKVQDTEQVHKVVLQVLQVHQVVIQQEQERWAAHQAVGVLSYPMNPP